VFIFPLEICVRELNHDLKSMNMKLEYLNLFAGKETNPTAQPLELFPF
jgi:hypothetical protein